MQRKLSVSLSEIPGFSWQNYESSVIQNARFPFTGEIQFGDIYPEKTGKSDLVTLSGKYTKTRARTGNFTTGFT